MIKSIQIQKEASYGDPGETLSELSKFNFIYGSNGTGKTTISRIIADEAAFSDCYLVWQGGIALQPLVYNRDFVEKNFSQSSELKGIFTLGEKDKDILQKIMDAKKALNSLKEDGLKLKITLEGEDGNGGNKAELEGLESEFEEKCWKYQKKHEDKLQGAFTGVRGKKSAFKRKLLDEAANNPAELKKLEDIENRAVTVFGETPQAETIITVPIYEILLNLESSPILKKKVIGKEDVDIAAMIQKLGNSDWVKQGRKYYEVNEYICPFCQQKIASSFTSSLNAYFDDVFEKDVATIELLLSDYKMNGERLQQSLQSVLENPSRFLDTGKLKVEVEILDSRISANIQRIEKKRKELSQSVELELLNNILTEIKELIDSANNAIRKHNIIVSNLAQEKRNLTSEVWKYLLENEIKEDLFTYRTKKNGLQQAIDSLNAQIEKKRLKYKEQDAVIKKLERNTTSIQPTIDEINNLLESFGFTNFSLAKSKKGRFYKIQRPDGTDANETLRDRKSVV